MKKNYTSPMCCVHMVEVQHLLSDSNKEVPKNDYEDGGDWEEEKPFIPDSSNENTL